jgi:hypothetical protein
VKVDGFREGCVHVGADPTVFMNGRETRRAFGD